MLENGLYTELVHLVSLFTYSNLHEAIREYKYPKAQWRNENILLPGVALKKQGASWVFHPSESELTFKKVSTG